MKNNNKIWVLGHKISPVEVSGNYDMVIGETPPGVPGPPPHYHCNLQELFMVLEGEMEFVVDGEKKLLKKGDTVDLPANAIHTFRNSGSSPCTWLNVHSPKGFLSFFHRMGVKENESEAMKKSIDEKIVQKVMAEAASFDMHIQL